MSGRWKYVRAAAVGAALASVVELSLLLSGGPLLGYEPLGDVFDAQARSLLDGRWDVPADVMKIEGFEVDGRTYTYFGPVPAVLRMPIVAVTDRLDGRLTRLSLIGAWAVTIVMATQLAWRARTSLRGSAEVSRVEEAAVGAWVFTIGAGSSIAYLASRPSVFHEAIGWGVAVSLVAIDAVLRWYRRRTAVTFAVALVLATVALLTRASVGAAPAAALGLALASDTWRAVRRREIRSILRPVALATTLVVPLVVYAAVNLAKFDTLFTLPYEKHVVSKVDPHRREVLAANGGTIQGLHFLPTTLAQYVRPDAIGFDDAFPWIDFPRRAPVFGGVVMDQVDVASSVPTSMPALTAVASAGGVILFRRRRARAAAPSTGFVFAIAGSAVALVVTLAIGFIAQRYTADAVPLLIVAGAPAVASVGAHAAASRSLRFVAPAAAAAAVALTVTSVLVTAALTIQFQQHYGFLTPQPLRAKLAARQLDLPAGDGAFPVVRTRAGLPDAVAPDRTFAIVGSCDGLYRSDGSTWQPVEGTPAVGHYRVRVELASEPAALPGGIVVRRAGRDVLVERGDAPSRPLRIDGDTLILDVVADPLTGFVDVRHDGQAVLSDFYLDRDDGPFRPTGTVGLRPTPTPVCDQLAGRSS